MSNYSHEIPQWPNLGQFMYVGQQERTDELNSRIFERSVPDSPLPTNFSPRSTPTKYARFPILDNRMPSSVPIVGNYDYSCKTNFTPPVQNVGPVSGFINNVDVENTLRNQYFGLQRGAGQNIYIPSSDSDLYKVVIPSRPSVQQFPGLFQEPTFDQTTHANLVKNTALGSETFNNNTRTQLRTI